MPSSFRFGPVEVSCEGYARPGDKYVLQGPFYRSPISDLSFLADTYSSFTVSGSCGLEYNLIRIDPKFEAGSMPYVPGKGINWGKPSSLLKTL